MSTDPTSLAHEVLDLAHEDETVTVCSIPDNKAATLARAVIAVPALVDALEKVRELHQPVGEEVIPWDCAEGDCDHEDDEHPLDTATLCGECYRLAVEVSPYYGESGCSAVLWPCPTFKAITDALDTNH